MAISLNLPRQQCAIPIGGLNDASTASMSITTATIKSRVSNYNRNLIFYIIPSVVRLVPSQPLHRAAFKIPKNLPLADPEFHRPAPVDILLGSGPTLSILCIGQIDISAPGAPDLLLQKTQFGWVIGGSPPPPQNPPQSRKCFVSTDVHFDLSKFWEIEEGQASRHLTKEQEICEKHFTQHVSRTPDGRYTVALPFNARISELGESKQQARKRLRSIERKLDRNDALKKAYHSVLNEYITLGHMSPVDEKQDNEPHFYLPHHAVIKASSVTTAVRVVFDGSAKSSTGTSLNDTLLLGPTIQSDLLSLVLRFRKHKYVITGDIEKMYRQFLVRPEDRKFQRILWKNEKGQEQTYELNTVTFGLTSAPYLAIRGLHQLAEDEGNDFPQTSKILKNDFYVDDALTGANTINELIKIRKELTGILERGKLKIRQWASNAPEALEGLPEESINQHLLLGDGATIKTLGLKWRSMTDTIVYTVKPPTTPSRVTKRTILSETAKIFDPLGILAPVITTAKIMMQRLWVLKLDWDESLPTSIHTSWLEFHSQLQLLNEIHFSRKVVIDNPHSIELHGFCDASELAYGACIYIRSTDQSGRIFTTLLCSKSRVAPVKTITIPRLELCGAVLLCNLAKTVIEALNMKFDRIFYWTDSTIVLHWLKMSPQSLKTFVANRVTEVQEKTSQADWHHIRTHDNPADLVSRGQLPKEFIKPSLWQHGPSWLSEREDTWPVPLLETSDDAILETRAVQCFHVTSIDDSILTKYSTMEKLERIIAYCRRLLKNHHRRGHITLSEIQAASSSIVKLIQKTTFAEEIQSIKDKKSLKNHSRLLPLNPILDDNGILRVGGRLKNSFMPFSQKHPIIIPKGHHVTQLIIEAEHRMHLHAGVQATLYALRRRYWIIDGRNEVRKILRQCVTCSKLQPPSIDYIMGDLPSARVTQARPFSRVGIDYCGPFFIKEKKLRNRNKIKVYIAIFVCLSVKAVHLELVSDLSTAAFIAALRRFVGRRGMCSDIYSDNGTNFVGAHHELKDLHVLLTNPQHQRDVNSFATQHHINWHFIPARAPNFGGLWEAAVKSFKHHLRRVVGLNIFTYEELNTFAIEIEAVLNSRPLTPISSDPNDLLVLTPGHFLIGDSLTSLPEREMKGLPANRLSSWQHIQQVRRHFWTRWSREYLNELTVRHKWTKDKPTIQEGAIVLLKDDNLPPLQWVMGRVVKLHPGADGVTRVVTVKTNRNTVDRSVKKLAPLPINAST